LGDLTQDRTVAVDDTVVRTSRTLTGGDGVQAIGNLTQDRTIAVDDTVARTDRNEMFGQNVTIQGDLTVKGTEFVADVQTVEIEDNLAVLNDGETGAGVTAGFAGWDIDRGGEANFQFGFDENRDRFVTGQGAGARQVVATREDNPDDKGIAFWDQTTSRFDTDQALEWTGSALETTGDVLHPQFTPKMQKWAILSDGSADFRSIYADELRVDRFIAEVNEALAGEDFLTKSFAKLDQDWTVPQAGSSAELTLQNLPGLAGSAVFEEGDTVRLRYVDRSGGGLTVADVWIQVTKPTGFDASGETQTWSATTLNAGGVAGETIKAGSVALDYGISGDHLIERSVLGGTFDRILRWEDTTGDGVPDTFETINYRGELSNLPKAKASGPGVYSSQARFDENAIIGDLEAATSDSTSGSYLKFTQDEGLEVVVAGGENVGTRLDEIQAELELTASEMEARFQADVAFEGSTASVSLVSNADGSSARLAGDSITLDGDTTFFGTDYNNPGGIPGDALAEDYTQSGTENVTIRDAGEPNSNTSRPNGDSPLKGDLYIDTSDADRPYNYDGNNWIQAYTNIQGGDIDTGSLFAQNADITALLSVGGASSGDRVEIDGDTADPKMIQYSGDDAVVVVTSERSSGSYSPTQLYNQSFSGSNSHTLTISGESEGELYYDLAVRDTAVQQGKVFVLFKDADTGNVIGRTEEREFTSTEFWTGAFRCPENVSSLEVSIRSSLSSLASGYQFTNQASDPATQLWIHKIITIIDRSGVTVKKGNNRTVRL
jgi:hypothetical protein